MKTYNQVRIEIFRTWTEKIDILKPSDECGFEVNLNDGWVVYMPEWIRPTDAVHILHRFGMPEMDLVTTLSNFYDPNYMEQNRVCLINDGRLNELTFKELTQDYMLYDYGEKNYWSNDPRTAEE